MHTSSSNLLMKCDLEIQYFCKSIYHKCPQRASFLYLSVMYTIAINSKMSLGLLSFALRVGSTAPSQFAREMLICDVAHLPCIDIP